MGDFNQQAAALFNFDDKFDVSLLDFIVSCAFEPRSPHFAAAQGALVEFQNHPNSWTRVDAILEFSTLDSSKFLALNILESLIRIRWKALPRDQCENIKRYVIGYVTKCSSDDQALSVTKDFRVKLDETLVAIVKQEWPQYWPSFIPDIVAASKANLSLCENNMTILKLLSEELFDFSSGKMTQAKAKHLKQQMCNEFTQLFELCSIVLRESSRSSLIYATLNALQSFLSWIPLGYIFETPLIQMLVENFLPVPEFQNVTLKCLSEIGALNTNGQYDELFIQLYTHVMERVSSLLPSSGSDLNVMYFNASDEEQAFVQNLTLFFTGFFREHVSILESRPELHPLLLGGHFQLVMISEVEETELFKVCLEYWNSLALSLYSENPYAVSTAAPLMLNGPSMGDFFGQSRQTSSRRELYAQVLTRVRAVMISRMARPEEVLVVEEDNEIIREHVKDTDSINIYKSARETLVYLTHLDCADTESIMTRKLLAQVNGSEWSWKNLNTLCWAIGSISGAMNEEDEKRFLVTVIRELLGLCEFKRGKDNKAVIASNIMYIVGQYPRFLRAHWKFLKTVVQKLFEFMHESHEGVQDMACDTFIKIAQKCRRHFVTLQTGEVAPYIDRLLVDMPAHISDLTAPQQQTFFEAVGYMISAQMEPMTRERLIERFMQGPNATFDSIISRAIESVDVFRDAELVRSLTHTLRLNIRACVSIGHPFVSQLGRNYMDMLNVYKAVSDIINDTIRTSGEITTTHMSIKSLMTVKMDILKLLESWVSRSEDSQLVVERFLPPLLDAILLDYQQSVPVAREPEVLRVLTTMITTVKDDITPAIPAIFDAVFGCTLDMINKDLLEFPDHRTNFFLFLKAINEYCFTAFFRIPADQFQLVINSIVWAIQHTMRDVADTGLTVLLDLLVKVGKLEDDSISQTFHQTYFLTLMQHVFVVLTDSSHAPEFKMHATILATMFDLVNSDTIRAPLFNPAEYPAMMTNKAFFTDFIALKLKEAFPHLVPSQIDMIVKQLASSYRDLATFKNTLRDFLIQIREIQNEDDLFLEEKEMQQQLEQVRKQEFQASVPGILKPGERDDMADVNNYEDHELDVYQPL